MMWGYDMTGMGWWMVTSSIVWLGLIAVAVWAFARWASRAPQQVNSSPAPAPPATEILRQRFARGEIDGDTFERMRQQLEVARTDQWVPTNIA
jgi:putative membrane protein